MMIQNKIKSFLTIILIVLGFTLITAQEVRRTCTVIDVIGDVYSDRLWLFSVPETSDGFDNGWDGYKFLKSTSNSPQIYAVTLDGNFQVSTVADIHNKIIGFVPGAAAEYTLTFTHTDLAYTYQKLYLIDRLVDKTVDVYEEGSSYTFSAKKGDYKERFVLVTSVNLVDTLVSKINTDNNKAKNVRVYGVGKKLFVDNHNNQRASLKIVNARNGKIEKQMVVDSEAFMSFDTNLELGAYIICTSVETDLANTTVLLE